VRLETLADGVFAIVMTLLVLELAVPAVAHGDDAALAEGLREMLPDFLIYALSFLVLGAFWLIHKMEFESFATADPPMIWIHILFLMAVALLPFSTALVGEHGVVTTTAVFYGGNVLLAFALAWTMWLYATGRRRLVADDLDQTLITGGNRMGVAYMAVMGTAVLVSLWAPLAAFVVYTVFVGTIILATLFGRWEAVMVWATDQDLGE
jgi:uncharacterized membrane protein